MKVKEFEGVNISLRESDANDDDNEYIASTVRWSKVEMFLRRTCIFLGAVYLFLLAFNRINGNGEGVEEIVRLQRNTRTSRQYHRDDDRNRPSFPQLFEPKAFASLSSEISKMMPQESLKSVNNKDTTANCDPSKPFDFDLPNICASGQLLAIISTNPASFDFSLDKIGSGVLAIVLAEVQIRTKIPTYIGQLSQLKWLVGIYAFEGTIPSEVGSLASLNIIIIPNNDGSMSSTLPTEIGQLEQLSMLDVHTSGCYGTIPSQIGTLTSLGYLNFEDNSFQGSIPSEITELTLLTGLIFSTNSITLKDFDLTPLVALQDLELSGNTISSIPSGLTTLTGLTNLAMAAGRISGTLPADLSQLTLLTSLDLGSNSFSSSIPTTLGSLTSLNTLILSVNQLSGQIPSEIGQIPGLLTLNLDTNKLNGTVPQEIWKMTNLTDLRLSGNFLVGPIPSELRQFSRLQYLGLGDNLIEGTFLTNLTFLPLKTLAIQGNKLSGTIPSQICIMTTLETLKLSYNSFTGTLPNALGNLTALTLLDISHNNFTGKIPTLPAQVELKCDYSGIQDSRCAYIIVDNGDYLAGSMFIVVVAFSAFISLLILFIAVLFIIKRKHPIVHASGLVFNLCTLFGLLCVVVSVIPFGLTMNSDQSIRDMSCKTTFVIFVCGIITIFSAISARNYPIWKMYDPSVKEKMPLPKIDVIRPVLVISTAAIVLMSILSADMTGVKLNHGCVSNSARHETFVTIIIAIGILTALFASYSSFAIRRAPIDFSDAKQVMIATFNILTFGAAMTILALTSDTAASQFLSVSFSVILGVVTFWVFVHASKAKSILFDTIVYPTNPTEKTA